MRRVREFRRRRGFEPAYFSRVWCNCYFCRSEFKSVRFQRQRWVVPMSMLGVERDDGTFYGKPWKPAK